MPRPEPRLRLASPQPGERVPPKAMPERDLDGEALTRLRGVTARLGPESGVEEDDLLDLAWSYFVAGFTAGHRSATEAERPEPEPGPQAPRLPSPVDPVASLTPRRLEVLRLVARGLTNREIASALDISAHTVKAHLAALFETLDVSNRTEAAFALQQWQETQQAAHCHDPLH